MAVALLSQSAIDECVAELRAACRRPINEDALEQLCDWLRPNFREILDRPEGKTHWTEHGRHMRDNGRYIGALADFIGHRGDVDVVGAAQLMEAFVLVRDACRVGAPGAAATRASADDNRTP